VLLEKNNKYLNGEIEKHRYMEEMFETHRHLFEYPTLIKNSPIQKIEINNEEVIFTIHNANNSIMICCDEKDAYSLSMTFLNFSAYEADESDMILKLIKPGDVVFDIGANIGWYTLNVLLKHKGTSVYSFEPIKSSYQYLKKNLTLNHQKTDKIYNIGLSDENKTVKFFFDTECTTASSMVNLREDKDTVMVECEVKRLDDVFPSFGINRLDFIKCDVEGAEKFVFEGGIKTIRKYKPIIFSEMLRKWSKKFGYHPDDIIHLLADIGYHCYGYITSKIEKIDSVTPELETTNFFFFQETKHKKTIETL